MGTSARPAPRARPRHRAAWFETLQFLLLMGMLLWFAVRGAQDVQVTTQRVFEVFVFIGCVYFVICFTLSRLFAHLEHRHTRAHK
jgi:ABC-type amino acid transport system permease subunit